MGNQSYAIPYDTDEQLAAILEVIKLHNSYGGGFTEEFVRYNPEAEFKQLEVGEEFTSAFTAAFKTGKAYKCPRKGPCLARVVLVGHRGGHSRTISFFHWHLMRAFPDVYVNRFHAMDAYGYDSVMEKRLLTNSHERIDPAHIGAVPDAEYTDATREANLIASYTPVPAKYSTRMPVHTPAVWTALMEGAIAPAERKKRQRENPRVSPYSQTYETTTEGWVLDDRHFPTEEEAKAYADSIRPAHVGPGCMAAMRGVEAKGNMARFLKMRAEGKAYYTAGHGTRFWLTEEGLADRRAEGKDLKPAAINYEEEGYEYCTPWKQAPIADIEAMLAAGKPIVLHSC